MKQAERQALARIEAGHGQFQPCMAIGADGGGFRIRTLIGQFGSGIQWLHRADGTAAIEAAEEAEAWAAGSEYAAPPHG